MDTAEELRMNLASLQRIDPYIVSIKESASQVALYTYSATQEWEKTETEGTLFVYERKCEPMYGFLILNRLSTQNWIQPITSEIDSQLQAPFLLYKTKDAEIFGIWFYEKEKCELVSTAIDDLVKDTEKRMNQRSKALQSSSGIESKKGTDLSSLLSNAASAASNKKIRPQKDTKTMPSLKTTKESPSGGEKLLRLLASGTAGTKDMQPKQTPANTEGIKNMPLNFAQVTAGARVKKENGAIHGHKVSTETATPKTYNSVVRSRQESTNFSEDLYTEEDIQIMSGEKSPSKEINHNPSTGSVAQFFAQACEQEQKHTEKEDINQPKNQPRSEIRPNGIDIHQPIARTSKVEPTVNLMTRPPGAVVTGGPPGIQLPIPCTSAPTFPTGIVPIMPGGIPGMALLPQQPGAPPIMVPLIPSTQAHLINQQQQIRLAVAHAQAAAAMHTIRHEMPPATISNTLQGMGLHNFVNNSPNISAITEKPASSPQLPALQTLLSNPAAMSVESLERAHREESRTPPISSASHSGHGNFAEMPPVPAKATVAKDLESDLSNKLNISKSEIGEKQRGSSSIEIKGNDRTKQGIDSVGGQQSYAGAAKSPNKRAHKGRHQSNEFDAKLESAVNKTPNSKQYLKHQDIETEEVQLLSPMVFSQPVNGHRSSNMNNDTSVLDTDDGEITPLTKSQLAQAMQHLLKTDPSFVGKLHSAYVESLNHKLN